MPGCDGGGQHTGDDAGYHVALVERERVAPEQAVLEASTVEVGGAVEVHDAPVHEPSALVVEGLAKIALPERITRIGMRR